MKKIFAWIVGILLIAIFLALLVANHSDAVGRLVDAPFFQLMLMIALCLAVALAMFGLFDNSTASMQPGVGKWAITLGGPIAGFVALLVIILPNLTPTTRLSLYFREATAARPGQAYRVPNGLDVVLVLPEGSLRGKSSETDVSFPYLPKGEDMEVTVDSARYRLAGIFPESCSVKDANEFKLRAGCRKAYLCIADAINATFTNLRELPPVNLSLPAKQTLKQAVMAFADQLQRAAVARDKNAVVSTPNWRDIGNTADQTFAWKNPPEGSGTCPFANRIQESFNAANPKTPVDLIVQERGLAVQLKSSNGKRDNDICSGPPPTPVDPIKLAAACDH